MFLDGTAHYVSDYDNISTVPWMFEQHFIDPWNRVAETCKYRTFVHAKSKAASCKRLGVIIQKNAALLGGSRRTDMEVLTHRFLERWILACDYIIENHEDDSDGMEVFGKKMTVTMGCWQFLEPDLKAIVHLSGLKLGDPDALKTLDQDKRRRQAKAELCRDFEAASREFVRKLTYVTGSDNKWLEDCFNRAINALAEIEDEASWTDS